LAYTSSLTAITVRHGIRLRALHQEQQFTGMSHCMYGIPAPVVDSIPIKPFIPA
jgi:hypothetical protein